MEAVWRQRKQQRSRTAWNVTKGSNVWTVQVTGSHRGNLVSSGMVRWVFPKDPK